MQNPIKIAFYTDFSDESRVSLNTLIFNTWGFDFDLDILCFYDINNINEVKENVKLLKEELNFHLEDGHSVLTKTFLNTERQAFINHINGESYFSLLIGIADSQMNWEVGSIYHTIYSQAKVDLCFVPLRHQVKIENRGIVALEFENLEKLYALQKSEEFFKFYFAKIRLMVISENKLSNKDNMMIMEFVSKILPELDIDLINVKKAVADDAIFKAATESPIDYFHYFADDYLEEAIQRKLEDGLLPGVHKFTLSKLWLDDEMLNKMKYKERELPKIQLRSAEKNISR